MVHSFCPSTGAFSNLVLTSQWQPVIDSAQWPSRSLIVTTEPFLAILQLSLPVSDVSFRVDCIEKKMPDLIPSCWQLFLLSYQLFHFVILCMLEPHRDPQRRYLILNSQHFYYSLPFHWHTSHMEHQSLPFQFKLAYKIRSRENIHSNAFKINRLSVQRFIIIRVISSHTHHMKRRLL